MRKLLWSILLFMHGFAFSAEQCGSTDGAVIFFGNGINTSFRSASASLQLLKGALGPTYNSQPLRYDLAYNQTGGMLDELLEAAAQAGVQWDSQVMGWLVGLGVAPDWFASWYSNFLLKSPAVVASDVDTHIRKYVQSIRFGRKALVVSHSQGNFYVNEAKQSLARQLTAVEMQSFGIFGVATPADNVGGDAMPYFTNHRDIIQIVPGALPHNWTLRRADGSVADDVSRIEAHLFDTYMSSSYDLRASLLLGIRQQLSALQSPSPSCDSLDYRKQFVRLVAGTYLGSCDGSENYHPAAVSPEGIVALPDRSVDVTLTDMTFAVLRQLKNESGAIGDQREIAIGATSTRSHGAVSGRWDVDGTFASLSVDTSGCDKRPSTPPTVIPREVDIASKAASLMEDYRDSFPPGSCVVTSQAGVTTSLERQPVIVAGKTLTVGDRDFDLTADLVSEKAVIYSIDLGEQEPQFEFLSELSDGGYLTFTYKAYSGLTALQRTAPTYVLTCTGRKN